MERELTVTEALAIMSAGWSGDIERELYVISLEVVKTEARRCHLEYQKSKIEDELKENSK